MSDRKKNSPDSGQYESFFKKHVDQNSLAISRLLKDIQEKKAPKSALDDYPELKLETLSFEKIDIRKISADLAKIGIFSPVTLAEMAIRREDPSLLAKYLKIDIKQMITLMYHAYEKLSKEQQFYLRRQAKVDNKTGAYKSDSDDFKFNFREDGLDRILTIKAESIESIFPDFYFPPLYYFPKAVDYRPYLGPARNQNPRGTCYSFGATTVREFHENIRAGKAEKIDLSEEYIVWYSKKGQAFSAGGGDGIGSLKAVSVGGIPKEDYCPYISKDVPYNHSHIPITNEAIDNARFYKGGEVVKLGTRNVLDIKTALLKGKVVVIHSSTDGWSNSSGEIRLPFPGEGFDDGGHAVAIIGFVDSPDVPEEWEGGFFIIRNSWGDISGINNIMGNAYGGHLRMPYAYYRQFTSGAATFVDDEAIGTTSKNWIAEYYANKTLQGKPILQLTVNSIDFEWEDNGPITQWLQDFFGLNMLSFQEDHFSARWSTTRFFKGGFYNFDANSDDGIRIWLDEQLVINSWKNQVKNFKKNVYIPEGMHVIRIEYYENTGNATAQFTYQPIDFDFDIYPNANASGNASFFFKDCNLAWEAKHIPPVTTDDNIYSIKSKGKLYFDEDDQIIFHATASGGIKIKLDDAVIIDQLNEDNEVYESSPVDINKGEHNIEIIFRNTETVPLPGDQCIYHSHFAVNWYQTKWNASLYHGLADERNEIYNRASDERTVDHIHQLMQQMALAGTPFAQKKLDTINFPDFDSLKNQFNGDDDFPKKWISLFAHKKIVTSGGKHRFRLRSGNYFRLIIDGQCLLQNHHIIGTDYYDADIELDPGVHDVAVEVGNSKWGIVLVLDYQGTDIWDTQWFNNTELSGTPIHTNKTGNINFDWEDQDPEIPGIDSDGFSARFETTTYLMRGRYRFITKSDDGVRLYINGALVIDSFYDHAVRCDFYDMDIFGGATKIRLEYYENTGKARFYFNYFPIGFLGEYYQGTNLGRDDDQKQIFPPYMYRYEPDINFDWSSGSPSPRISRNNYSARWSGKIDLPVGRYEIKSTTDDGVRVFIDGKLILESWRDQHNKVLKRKVDLTHGYHDIMLEYFENDDTALCQLELNRIL
ncbi:MAG: PA14 domain-containing protein [Spirochaetes bacterium]|nr:PA14 domain-containing protein [Spirochaetota bacterium]